jgi:hypothetical protein
MEALDLVDQKLQLILSTRRLPKSARSLIVKTREQHILPILRREKLR